MTFPLRRSIVLCLSVCLLIAGQADAQFFEHKERSLGPTGMFGVTSPKDIRIEKVDEGSPADGKIEPGDVIVKAGGRAFAESKEKGSDPVSLRKQLAAAIDAAQTEQGGGVLSLELKDGGTVELQLPVLGAWGGTAPFDSAKTDAMITAAADAMIAKGNFGRGDMNIGLLGLLATGEDKYIAVVKEQLHAAEWCKPEIDLSLEKLQRVTWQWGYQTILLCEYYLLTGDDYVLPAIREYAVTMAKGRDAAGLWGHTMATYDLNFGKAHGRLPGYSVMNASSLPCFIALLLAKECGVEDPDLDAAIEQTHGFYTDYIHKGTLPYGVHDPKPKDFNNNGMSGMLAVAFALHGNNEGGRFFAEMSLAANDNIETGHTGHFFNQMWTGLGANLGGPKASQEFFANTRWLHTLNQTHRGDFTYDDSGSNKPIYSYRGMSDTGSHLLNLSLGRERLYITGREADASLYLTDEQVAEIATLHALDMNAQSNEQLLEYFGHAMPKVRVEAVWTLRGREDAPHETVMQLIDTGPPLARESAIGYFGYGCPDEVANAAIPTLVEVLKNDDEPMELRVDAANALAWRKAAAHEYFDDVIQLLLKDKTDDPRGIHNMNLGRALTTFTDNPYADGLVKDKQQFYAAIRKLLDHPRSYARAAGTQLLLHMPPEDFPRVGDRLSHILAHTDRSYTSYHNLGPITNAHLIYARLGIRDGVAAALEILKQRDGKFGFKRRMILKVLPAYGPVAKQQIDTIKTGLPDTNRDTWKDMIESIEAINAEGSESISFEEAMKAGAESRE